MGNPKPTEAVLSEYFTTTPKPGAFVLKCKACPVSFEVKTLELRPGAVLTLLNHALGHVLKSSSDAKKRARRKPPLPRTEP